MNANNAVSVRSQGPASASKLVSIDESDLEQVAGGFGIGVGISGRTGGIRLDAGPRGVSGGVRVGPVRFGAGLDF